MAGSEGLVMVWKTQNLGYIKKSDQLPKVAMKLLHLTVMEGLK